MKLMLTLILLTINSLLFAPEINQVAIVQGEPIKPFESIWRAVCLVESSGRADAYHMEDNGFPSIGIGQIQQSRLNDFNVKSGNTYSLADMYDPEIAKKVFYWYCNDPYNLEKIARCWNGGEGNGMRIKETHEYYLKVLKHLK
jgi:hypothetical protein